MDAKNLSCCAMLDIIGASGLVRRADWDAPRRVFGREVALYRTEVERTTSGIRAPMKANGGGRGGSRGVVEQTSDFRTHLMNMLCCGVISEDSGETTPLFVLYYSTILFFRW